MKGVKRKLPANDISKEGLQKEKERYLEVFKKMKRPELDLEAAVNKQIKLDNVE